MPVRKLIAKTAIFGLTLLLSTAMISTHAEADPPKAANAVAPKVGFTRAAFKTATKPALSVTPELKTKVKVALDKALADFAKDKNATKLMKAGVALGPDAESVYRAMAVQALSSQPPAKYVVAGSAPRVTSIPATYSIESGEVVSASNAASCGGEIRIAFTVKNRGAKLPQGTTAKLFTSLARASAPTTVVSSAWLNLPPLDTGASATIEVPSLRHTMASSGGSCLSGLIMVTPSFTEAKAASDYRLRIELTDTGADATLLSGMFLAPGVGSSSGPGLPGSDDCLLGSLCSPGVCSLVCPPCPPPFKESNGGCALDPGSGGVFF